jgi:hypothetical protein
LVIILQATLNVFPNHKVPCQCYHSTLPYPWEEHVHFVVALRQTDSISKLMVYILFRDSCIHVQSLFGNLLGTHITSTVPKSKQPPWHIALSMCSEAICIPNH